MLNRLNLKYPIFQGGMAHIATPEFAAAVSNAGALGIIGTGAMKAGQVKEAIQKCRALTDRPFGVNVMLMNPEAEQIIDVLCKEKPAVVTLGAGNASLYIPGLREAGCLVIPVVSNTALARRLEKAGADAIIAEGCEAGGHIGQTTTMSLIPQMVDALHIPVIAAGGIADGRGMMAARALGACGVQVGTCLIASEECPVHENYKQAVLKARDSSTVVTGTLHNTPVRILKNRMSREYVKLEKAAADRDEMEKLTLGAYGKAVYTGDIDQGSVMMGQIAGLVKEIRPLSEIFESMMDEYTCLLEKAAGMKGHSHEFASF